MNLDSLPTVAPYSTGIDVSDRELAELFPAVNPEFRPFGTRVVVQLRRTVNKTKSGIVLVANTKETEAWNIQVGRIVSVGPLAFKKRDTAEPWPEGIWATVGDFVKVPRWGGDRWSIEMTDGGEPVAIVLVNDSDLIGAYTGDPLKIKAYLQ